MVTSVNINEIFQTISLVQHTIIQIIKAQCVHSLPVDSSGTAVGSEVDISVATCGSSSLIFSPSVVSTTAGSTPKAKK